MTATFSNSRLSSLPCERMRGSLVFSEDFVSSALVEENNGAITGAVINRGALFDGGDSILFDSEDETADNISLVIKFNATGSGILVSNLSSSIDGFVFNVTDDYLVLTVYDGGVPATTLVETELLDGEDHTVTLTMSTTEATFYIDDAEADVYEIVFAPSSSVITVGFTLVGTIYNVRLFDALLVEEDHLDYFNNTLTSFMKNALATWRCDSVGDDTVGHKIWDKQSTVNDLYKADRADASAFPTFEADKYSFDFIDDYVSNIPELPDDYTVSAVVQNPYAITSEIRQENDDTLLTELSTAGQFLGSLRNMILHSTVLTAIQSLHSEYMQLYYIARGYAAGLYARLTVEGTAKATLVLSESLANWADGASGIATETTQTGDGLTFDNSNSNVTIEDSEDIRVADGSVVLSGIFNGAPGSEKGLLVKDGNYELTIDATHIILNGSKLALVLSEDSQVGVVWKDGYKPRFYVDGEFAGEGDIVVNITSTGTNDLIIGNVATLDANCPYTIDNVYVGDEPLTDAEILAMFNQSKVDIEEPEFISLQSTVDGDIGLQSTVDGEPILQSTVI